MKKLTSTIIGARALNAARKLHLPTYVATRFLLETVAGKDSSSWINEVVTRKHLLRDKPSFFSAKRFKNINKIQDISYRDFYVPSPTSILAEAILLGYISQSEAFKKNPRVFSYLWPSSKESPYTYEHYISGYKKRNEEIAAYLSLNPNKLVVVSDIAKFYPSIDQVKVKHRFSEKLEHSGLPHEIQELGMKLIQEISHQFEDGKGIATGPEMSHLVGDIALEEIDTVLEQEFGDAYFRYVDDIVLVVDASQKGSAIELLESLAKNEGLSIHPDKTDVLTGDLWQKHGPHLQADVQDDSFEALVFKVKTFLQLNPDAEETLTEKLEDVGFSLPIGRFSLASKSAGFWPKLLALIELNWGVAISAARSSEEDIVDQANLVREAIRTELYQYIEADVPDGATLRKWHLQRLRYLTNRAFYLFPFGELESLIPKLEPIPEFADSVALLKTLISRDAGELMQMPGPALSACAGLLKQNRMKLADIRITQDSTLPEIESASTFALWDVANIVYSNISLHDNDIVEYLKFSSGVSSNDRDKSNFGYLDEVKSLASGKSKVEFSRRLESRLYDTEGAVLDALDIGWNSEY